MANNARATQDERKGRTDLFTCECGVKQPLHPTAYQSVSCLVCGTKYAIVDDGEGNKAMVKYFHQERPTKEEQ